jgi:hypothetical protein
MRSVATTTSTTTSLSWWMLGVVAAGLVVVAVAAVCLARRRVTVRLAGAVAGRPVRALRGPCGEPLPLCLRVRLTRLSLRHLVRYGPLQELTSREVRKAKGGSHSLQISGVTIDKWEPVPFEDMEVWTTVPAEPGKYLAWTTSFEQGGVGGSGVSRFVFTVRGDRFTVRKVSYLGTWRLRGQRWIVSPNPYDLPRFPSLERTRW